MFQPKLFFSALIIVFIYWLVLFPIFWFFIKPLIMKSGVVKNISSHWITFVFCCGALIIFIIIFPAVLWCIKCYLRKGYSKNKVNSSNSTVELWLNSSEPNTKNQDQVEMNEIEPCKSAADAYMDIRDIFIQLNSSKLKSNTASQTTESLSSSPTDSVVYDNVRSYGRLNSCEECSKRITDEDIVNIFNKKLSNEIDMDKLVPQAQPRAKRSHIYENVIPNEAMYSNATLQQSQSNSFKPSKNAVGPVQSRRRLMSEVYFNDGYSPEVNERD